MVTSIESAPVIELADDAAELSRRDFLKRFGGVALGTAGAVYGATLAYEAAELINSVGTLIGHEEDEIWPHNEASFTWLNPETKADQSQFTLYLPGFGETNPEENARTWFKESGLTDMPMAYLDYSHQGTTLQHLVDLINADPFVMAHRNDPDFYVNAVGRSLGGLYSFPVLAEVDIPVKTLSFISSPSRLEYGDFGALGSLLAGLPKWRAVDTMVKAGVNTYRNYEQHGFHPIGNLEGGWEATMHGENPIGLQQELRAGKDIHILDEKLLARLRSGIIIPGFTEMFYAASYHPSSDITVHVQPSGEEYEKAARRLGARFNWIHVPYDGHANVSQTAHKLQPLILASTARNRFDLSA
jgi:hypothetical protein